MNARTSGPSQTISVVPRKCSGADLEGGASYRAQSPTVTAPAARMTANAPAMRRPKAQPPSLAAIAFTAMFEAAARKMLSTAMRDEREPCASRASERK